MLRQACIDVAALTGPAAALDIAVNLSPRQLTAPALIGQVRGALAGSGLSADRLLLEVTESAIVQDEDAAAIALEQLSQLGVRLAIDDFGTGYSSLLYLRRYPISTLKLDRAVGATSIGEGVETAGQYAALRAMDCQLAQGFLWSAAVPLGELAAALMRCPAVPGRPCTRSPQPSTARRPSTPTGCGGRRPPSPACCQLPDRPLDGTCADDGTRPDGGRTLRSSLRTLR